MKLTHPLGSSKATIVAFLNRSVLFSYETPVAVFVDGKGWFRTDEHFSVTTSRHINSVLGGADVGTVTPHSRIVEMANAG